MRHHPLVALMLLSLAQGCGDDTANGEAATTNAGGSAGADGGHTAGSSVGGNDPGSHPDTGVGGSAGAAGGAGGSHPGTGGSFDAGVVTTTSSISQYGITWTFESQVTSGQFANGDYWVVGPVTITSITPDCDGTHHGWMPNPVPGQFDPNLPSWEVGKQTQGFDARAGSSFDAASIPALPYVAQAGTSIVKAISIDPAQGYQRPVITTAAVLTVVDDVPPDNGASVFRPPYVGADKPLYSLSQIRTDLLPSFAPTASAGAISAVADRFQRLQLDFLEFDDARALHPATSMPEYGGDVGRTIADGALRLMLDEAVDAKMPALVAYLQAGIDYYHTAKLGMRWQNQGGNSPGKRIILAFTAAMFDSTEMKDFNLNLLNLPPGLLGGSPGLHEDGGLYRGYGSVVLWGGEGTAEDYWTVVANGGMSGKKAVADPYGFIDGGSNPGSEYQVCCTSPIWKGEVLAARLMPSVLALWDTTHLVFEYIDRTETVGLWAQPDPCAPLSEGGGSAGDGVCVLDPDLTPGSTMASFSCQDGKQCGRFPQLHATPGPGGSSLANEMWQAYR